MGIPKVESLSQLAFVDLGDSENYKYVSVDDFVTFIRTNKSSTDNNKIFKKENVIRELHSHSNGIKEENGRKYTPISSIYRYIFRNYDSFEICRNVGNDIINLTCSPTNDSSKSIDDKSTLQLYRKLIESDLFNTLWDEQQTFPKTPVHTVLDHRNSAEFKDNSNWNKVLHFESNFEKYCGVTDKTSFSTILRKKWDFLQSCLSMKELGMVSNKMASIVCQNNTKRKTAEELTSGISLYVRNIQHRPEVIEQLIVNQFQIYGGLDVSRGIACLGCSHNCCHRPGLHLYVCWENRDVTTMSYFSTIATSVVERYHHAYLREITFLTPGTIQQTENGITKRFELQDQMPRLLKQENVLFIHTLEDTELVESPDVLSGSCLCYSCFQEIEPVHDDTLGIDNFNLIKEWFTTVPLPIRIFLSEAFTCKQTLKKQNEEGNNSYLCNKISSLFCAWEGLLNILSQQYSGVIQDLNTDELLVNYHNITTVFNVTSHTGVTQSLRTGNRRLKYKSDSEICYFKTFLKAYPLFYIKDGEDQVKCHNVNLRQCHLILMMDNLVHLSAKSDPLPGESRTTQVCTLPITVKGVPKDALYIQNWHMESCDKSDSCSCLVPKSLGKQDMDRILLKLTQEEQETKEKFEAHSTWGVLPFLIDQLQLQPIKETSQNKDDDHYMLNGTFDQSMESMSIEDKSKTIDNDETSVRESDTSEATIDNTDVENISTDMNNSAVRDMFNNIESVESSSMEFNTLSDVTTLFEKHHPPPLLTRHPPPASGRDDDITVLRNVLDDIVVKTELQPGQKILFGPDFKIAQNIFKLKEQNSKYQCVLPEFPVLHLRKSKITNLISAYKSCGLIHILQYMKDEESEKDWTKLLSIDNIEKATRNIWRLSAALQLAFLTMFYDKLSSSDKAEFLEDVKLNKTTKLEEKWGDTYRQFINTSCKTNATFCMHHEIKEHCTEIIAIAVAERLGGEDGYNLLLSSVKSSLRFSFLNGATSYAGFCVKLLIEHFQSSHFHQKMKTSLFSTPHNSSLVNFGLDTAREMDHRIAKKCIRPGSTLESILPKMCTVDDQQKVHATRQNILQASKTDNDKEESDPDNVQDHATKYMGKTVTSTDTDFILRISKLIIRQKGLSTEASEVVKNVYHTTVQEHPPSILDRETHEIGTFLIKKFLVQSNLLGMTEDDMPNVNELKGPKALITRVKQAKGTTIARSRVKQTSVKGVKATAEDKRKKHVQKMSKEYDHLTSCMNTCQSVFKADGSKSSTNKSLGVKNALAALIEKSGIPTSDLILTDFKEPPKEMKKSVTKVIIEFAGAKFKMMSSTGDQYIQYINKGILAQLQAKLPNVDHIVICEEKYRFTPDDLKANTRQKRQKKETITISHLKEEKEIISKSKLSKKAVLTTAIGKSLISSYLAKNAELLNIQSTLTLDIDSEAVMCTCTGTCEEADQCKCIPYCIPVRIKFEEGRIQRTTHIDSIHQRKGEAEMAMMDWMQTLQVDLLDGESIVSFVTSADIDTVVIHLFAISIHWERTDDGNFKHQVYVWLQKKRPEIYNITGIIIAIEQHLNIDHAACIVALILSMGGNDFLPNYHGFSHKKLLLLMTDDKDLMKNLFMFNVTADRKHKITIETGCYQEVIKRMFCPHNLDHTQLSVEEVRQISIKPPNKDFKSPQLWMPPLSALEHLCKLIQCQIDYLLTTWNHSAILPNFSTYGCFAKTDSGDLLYDMGPDMHIENREQLLSISDEELNLAIHRAKIVRRKKCHLEKEIEGQEDVLNIDFDTLLDDIPLANMSLEDIGREGENQSSDDESSDEDTIMCTPDKSFRVMKRNLEETPGKDQLPSKRYPKMSTPKNRKARRNLLGPDELEDS